MGPLPQETFQHTITTHQRCGGGCPQPAHDGRRVLAGWRVSWVLFLGPCLLQLPPAQVIAPARKREDEELSAAAGPRACRVGAGSARKLRGSCCLVLRLSKAGSHRGEAAASGTPQEPKTESCTNAHHVPGRRRPQGPGGHRTKATAGEGGASASGCSPKSAPSSVPRLTGRGRSSVIQTPRHETLWN